MQSKAATVDEYLSGLEEPRRKVLNTVRRAILKRLPKGYEEGMQYGMIGYYVPHSKYPDGYHCDSKQPLPFASLAAQKHYFAFYCMGLYMDSTRLKCFIKTWEKGGDKPDMGKSCVRFKKIEAAGLAAIGEAVSSFPLKEYIALYENGLKTGGRRKKSKT